MKTKVQIVILTALVLNACDSKIASIQSELKTIEMTAKDTTQTRYVRESAHTFSEILSEKKGVSDSKLRSAHWSMVFDRGATSIATYVAFLKAIEKQLPDQLPTAEQYQIMDAKIGKSEVIEYDVAGFVFMLASSIKNISHYGDAAADQEVEGVLKRLAEKYGASETGKIILKRLRIEREQGLEGRADGIKPWESPMRPGGTYD